MTVNCNSSDSNNLTMSVENIRPEFLFSQRMEQLQILKHECHDCVRIMKLPTMVRVITGVDPGPVVQN